jgi:hypothetical protein
MTPVDITTLGQTLFGEPWLEKMAEAIGYSTSQLWRVAYDGAPITRRMQRELDKLVKKKRAKLPSELTSKGAGGEE